ARGVQDAPEGGPAHRLELRADASREVPGVGARPDLLARPVEHGTSGVDGQRIVGLPCELVHRRQVSQLHSCTRYVPGNPGRKHGRSALRIVEVGYRPRTPTMSADLRALNNLARAASAGENDVAALLARVCASLSASFGYAAVDAWRYLPERSQVLMLTTEHPQVDP